MLLGLATAAGLASAQGPLMFSAQLVGYEEVPAHIAQGASVV